VTRIIDTNAQHELGKLTAHERMEILFDPGSFSEISAVSGEKNAAILLGRGRVDGRLVFASAKDLTVHGGALTQTELGRLAAFHAQAAQTHAPVISLFDGAAAILEDGPDPLSGFDALYRHIAGALPNIAVVMGACVGMDSVAAALADFLIIVENKGFLAMSGPDIIRAVTNEIVEAEEIGGARWHATGSGMADAIFAHDIEALLQIRHLLDFLPDGDAAANAPATYLDDPSRPALSLDTLIPRDPTTPYNIMELIHKITDDGDFFQTCPAFARNLVTGLARFGGRPAGIIANQPMVLGGVLDSEALAKAIRFVGICERLGLPIVTLVDTPGFLPGAARERAGLAGHAATLFRGFNSARVPRVTVTIRNAIGAAGCTMAPRQTGASIAYDWPSARRAMTGGSVAAEMRRPEPRNDQAGFAKIIAPRETRLKIVEALTTLMG
jgi:propionyl-CoA carboxylase beta chain